MDENDFDFRPGDFNQEFKDVLSILNYRVMSTWVTKLLFILMVLILGLPWTILLIQWFNLTGLIQVALCAATVFAFSIFSARIVDQWLRAFLYHAFMHTHYYLFVRDAGLMKDVEKHVARYRRQDSGTL